MRNTEPTGRTDVAQDAGGEALVEVDGLSKYFPNEDSFVEAIEVNLSSPFKPVRVNRTWVKAVDDVSFTIREGEVLGLVGESGCGKSTLGETLLQLVEPTDGDVRFRGESLLDLSAEELRQKRREIQMIFQDPQSSLNPRLKTGQIIEAPMKAHGMYTKQGRKERAIELLEKVGLEPYHYNRHPHEFSGGQRQRINLARALSVDPDFIVCDEPVSALDVSIQASVLNTMKDLQEEFDLTYLFITHDLSVIRYIADRVAVMYLGEIAEIAETTELFENPRHPYTKSLLGALPVPEPDKSGQRTLLEGEVPSPTHPPSGCRFRTRCPVLIAPEQFDLTDEEWQVLLEFVRSVRRRSIDPSLTIEEVEAKYFADLELDGQLREVVEAALGALEADDWDKAEEILSERIEQRSVCAREKPAYQVEPAHGSDVHYCACHHVADEY